MSRFTSWRIARMAALLVMGGLVGLPATRADINGFGDGSNFTINDAGAGNGASITSGALQITANSNDERHGVWFNNPQIITAFTASFTWQLVSDSPGDPADGFTFCIQNAPLGIFAIGDGGGGLGYVTSVRPSAAVGFSVWGDHPRGTNLETNGSGFRFIDLFCAAGGGIDFLSHNPINVNLTYDATTLTEVVMDTVTGVSITLTYALDVNGLNIPNPDGTGNVGFTGATGGAHADLVITNFTYHEVH